MARFKFAVDISRCIECGGCEVACKRRNDVPRGIFRIRVITVNEGKKGEFHVPISCMHCTTPPCMYVCPVRAIWQREDGIVLVDKDKCIGCGYCLFACPFGVPQFPELGVWKGRMDKCTFCEGPEAFKIGSPPSEEWKMIVTEVIEKRKIPACTACSAFCATGARLAGPAEMVSDEIRRRQATKMLTRRWLTSS